MLKFLELLVFDWNSPITINPFTKLFSDEIHVFWDVVKGKYSTLLDL